MKYLVLLLFLTARLSAQWIVNDPINTLVNTLIQSGQAANHVEVMRQWAVELETLNQQLRQLEDQLAAQQKIRDVLGDPQSAGAKVLLGELGANDLAQTYGQTLDAINRLASSIASLRRTANGLYAALDDQTVLGRPFIRNEALYKRYGAVEQQADSLASVQAAAGQRGAALQADLAQTLEQLRAAPTQAEADKLTAKIAALNGQLAHLDAQKRDEADKLWAAQILNENQAAKERQDFLEKQQAEEQQTLQAVATWQESVQLTPANNDGP